MGWKIKKLFKPLKKAAKAIVTGVAVVAGVLAGLSSHKSSPVYAGNFAGPLNGWCSPVGNLSKPPKYFVLKMNDGREYAIPANAIPANAIPSNIREAWAIPSNAIPANAIPANAIPSNFWNYAIPANALPANAIPANAIPANGLPANAIPANALPANFYKTSAPDVLSLMQEVTNGKALPASIVMRDQLVQTDLQTGALLSDATMQNRVSQLKFSIAADPVLKTTCQSQPQTSLLSKTCSSPSTPCIKPISFGLAPFHASIVPQNASSSSGGSSGMTVSFTADSYALTRGECTNIHWDATGANKVSVNETPSDISGVKQVCPDASTTYVIVATGADGSQVSSSLSIQVQEPVVESNSGQELGGIDRCRVFDGINISSLVLEWKEGSPLSMYFKIPGGIPGLEKEIAGDTDVWKYSLEIGSYNSQNCGYKDYPERLYCTIQLPKEYSLAVVPMSLSVNGCDSPVYGIEKFGMVEMVIPESASGGGGKKDNSEGEDGQASVCPAGETYHEPNIYWSGGCCTDGHWYYYYSDDPAPGCWN